MQCSRYGQGVLRRSQLDGMWAAGRIAEGVQMENG